MVNISQPSDIHIMHGRLGNLGSEANFTPLYELVSGLMVLVQHHIGTINWMATINTPMDPTPNVQANLLENQSHHNRVKNVSM